MLPQRLDGTAVAWGAPCRQHRHGHANACTRRPHRCTAAQLPNSGRRCRQREGRPRTAPAGLFGQAEPEAAEPASLCLTEERFCFPEPLTLVLRQRLFSLGDDYSVRAEHGGTVFSLQGTWLSLNQKKVLLDDSRQPVAEVHKPALNLSLHDTWEVKGADGRPLAKVHKRFALWNKRVEVELSDGRHMHVDGDVLARNFAVRLGDQELATVAMGSVLQGDLSDTYSLRVAPGADAAFLALVTVLVDQLFHEEASK